MGAVALLDVLLVGGAVEAVAHRGVRRLPPLRAVARHLAGVTANDTLLVRVLDLARQRKRLVDVTDLHVVERRCLARGARRRRRLVRRRVVAGPAGAERGQRREHGQGDGTTGPSAGRGHAWLLAWVFWLYPETLSHETNGLGGARSPT